MSGTESTNKRKHAAASGVSPDQDVAVCESMWPFVGGRRFCKLKELTPDVLLEHARCTDVWKPCEVLRASVLDPQGKTTVVVIETGSSLDALKGRLAEETGTPKRQQYLFDPDGTNATEPLDNTHVLHTSCTLVLVVGETPFGWDPESSMLYPVSSQSESRIDAYASFPSYPRYDLMAGGSKIVRTTGNVDRHWNVDHAVLVVPKMTPATGNVHRFSFRVTSPRNRSVPPNVSGYTFDDLRVACGLVRAGQSDHQARVASWYISTKDGGLLSSPNQLVYNCEPEGEIPFGAVLCMTLDIARGTLRFAVDGVPRETGFVDISTPVQWAVTAPMHGTVIEIVPN